MYTLADLFNIRIGGSRRGVFIYRRGNSLRVFISPEKLNAGENMEMKTYTGATVVEALTEEKIAKENLYYIISPCQYYKTRLTLPFRERQKIEGILKYEVKDVLPFSDVEFLTDFFQVNNDVLSFSIEKDVVRGILDEFGGYRENLKAIIPFDMALFYGTKALLEDENFVVCDVNSEFVYIQWIDGSKIKAGVMVRSEPRAEMVEESQSTGDFPSRLIQELFMILKLSRCTSLYVNVEAGAEKNWGIVKDVFEEMEIESQEVPYSKYEKYLGRVITTDPGGALPLFGVLQGINKLPSERVNFLKEEFKPKLKGYVSVKEFTIAGILLLLLVVISTVNLVIDIGFRKNQVNLLRKKTSEIGETIFGEGVVEEKKAREIYSDLQRKLKVVEESTDLRFSALMLLRELVILIPGDVIVEFSDILIEKERIKFSGNTRTFSDIDRIRQGLMSSEYFTDVRVSNTGTTGSVQGFTVSFVFDISVGRKR
ncbi:MAG: hypothetical protein ACUVWJ_00760 [Spirochaetota bacterium]